MEYKHDIFYNVESLSQDDRLKLLSEAMEMSYNIVVDKIIGTQRQVQPDEDPKKWLINNLKHDSLWRFIYRRGYSTPYHLQVVIREGGGFLWVNLPEDKVNYFLEKYKLKML